VTVADILIKFGDGIQTMKHDSYHPCDADDGKIGQSQYQGNQPDFIDGWIHT
jgi:hypothetical protein